jgi:hypothetical protein
MGAQKKVNGRFPSARFGNSLRKIMFMHICFGISIIYTGCYLHLNNVVNTVSQADDQDMYKRALYYLLGERSGMPFHISSGRSSKGNG